MTTPPPPTRSGFTKPLHKQQIMSWIGYFLQLATFIFCILPTLTRNEKIGISISFLAIFLFYNVFFLLAARETHKSAWIEIEHKNEGFLCRYCEKYVKMHSKHCRSCNICRMEFDHHCFFLNNCVTKDNYSLFLLGIIFLGISSIYMSFLCVFVMMGNEYDKGALMRRAAEFYGVKSVPRAPIYLILCLMLIEMLGIQVFMIYLYALHFLLFMRGITTFELIQYRRQLDLEKRAKQNN